MKKSKICLFFVSVLLFCVILNLVFAQVNVGVKKGNWIEYKVATTGNPVEGHNVVWARMDILDVVGTEITVNITTKSTNGTFSSNTVQFDPSVGDVGVWFIIPANLNPGDQFYDQSMGDYVTIEVQEERFLAGATRIVTSASIPDRVKSWDKATGVFIETVDALPDETMYAVVDKTNMWGPRVFGMDYSVFLGLFFGVLAVLVLVIVVLSVALVKVKRGMRRG
jgi:hypothetical protein